MRFQRLVEEMIAVSGGLGIPRSEMPQIPSAMLPEFFNYLNAEGINTQEQWILADALKPTQTHVDSDKIGPERANHQKPILVSRDHYIMDGHHGWASSLGNEVRCIVIDLTIEDLLSTAWEFGSLGVAA